MTLEFGLINHYLNTTCDSLRPLSSHTCIHTVAGCLPVVVQLQDAVSTQLQLKVRRAFWITTMW
jgi:hypothetical protein